MPNSYRPLNPTLAPELYLAMRGRRNWAITFQIKGEPTAIPRERTLDSFETAKSARMALEAAGYRETSIPRLWIKSRPACPAGKA